MTLKRTHKEMDLHPKPMPMTRYEKASLIASAAGSVALVITLVFLTMEARDLSAQNKLFRAAVEESSNSSVQQLMFELSNAALANPDLFPYFRSNQPISPQDSRYPRALILAEMHLDFFDIVLGYRELYPNRWQVDAQEWDDYITNMFRTSPILRDYFASVRNWYPQRLARLWNEAGGGGTGPPGSEPGMPASDHRAE